MSLAKVFEVHLSNLKKPVGEQDHTIYADDLVCEFPYAPDGHTERLEGPEAFGQFLQAIGEFAEDHYFTEMEYEVVGERIVASFTTNFTVRETGRRVSFPMVYWIEARDGKIVLFREFYNPMKVLWAFGEV